MGSLEELLLQDLQDTGVFDLAASVGIVQHGRLQGGGPPEDEWPPSEPPEPPLGASVPHSLQQQVPHHGMDPDELHAANESVAACLRAAESATVALRLTDLQLAQWSAGEAPDPASPDGVPLPSPTAANGSAAAGPAAAAVAAAEDAAAAEAGDADIPSNATPPPAASGLPKRKRATRGGGATAASNAAGDASVPMAGAPWAAGGTAAAAAARKEPLGKASALRHFSMKVCEKVESKVDTSYEEVANELIADIAAEVAAGTAEAATDEKNIRRRCYDALNVLEAIGMIAKTKKSIRWKGWPSGLGRSAEERLRAERQRAIERLDHKRQSLEDAIQKCYCLSNLIVRNQEVPLPMLLSMQESGPRVPNPLKLPFILVRTDQDAELHVDISPDNMRADIDFGSCLFTVLDDEQVMKLLNLQHPSPLLDSALQQQQQQVESQLAAKRAQQAELQRQAAAAAALRLAQQQAQQLAQQPVARFLPQLVAGVPPSLRPQLQSALPPGASSHQVSALQLMPAGAHVAAASAAPPLGQPSKLQLPQGVGSPTAAAAGLGNIVSAMELGSPPAGAARAAAAVDGTGGAFGAAAQQQQRQQEQPQLRRVGAPALAPAAGIKTEPGTSASAAADLPTSAAMQQQLQLAAGWVVPDGLFGGLAAQQQLPQLRPAAAATLQQFQQQQQRQQHQQQLQQQPQLQQPWQQQPQQQQQPVLRPATQQAPTLRPAQPPS